MKLLRKWIKKQRLLERLREEASEYRTSIIFLNKLECEDKSEWEEVYLAVNYLTAVNRAIRRINKL